jgi:hypothetical protein
MIEMLKLRKKFEKIYSLCILVKIMIFVMNNLT